MPPLLSNAQPMTIGRAAAADEPATSATTVMAAASSATKPRLILRSITPSSERVTRLTMTGSVPRILLRLDESVERRVQWHCDPVALCLADERAGDQVDLGRPVCFDVFEHRRIVRVASLRRVHVHLPRILIEFDARRRRDGLALVD